MEKTQIEKGVKEDNKCTQAEPIEIVSKETENGNLMDQIQVLMKEQDNSFKKLVIKDTYDEEG